MVMESVEHIEVVDGTVKLRLGRKTIVARAGDVIVVPRSGSLAGLYGPAQLVAVLLGIPVTIYTLTKIIK